MSVHLLKHMLLITPSTSDQFKTSQHYYLKQWRLLMMTIDKNFTRKKLVYRAGSNPLISHICPRCECITSYRPSTTSWCCCIEWFPSPLFVLCRTTAAAPCSWSTSSPTSSRSSLWSSLSRRSPPTTVCPPPGPTTATSSSLNPCCCICQRTLLSGFL